MEGRSRRNEARNEALRYSELVWRGVGGMRFGDQLTVWQDRKMIGDAKRGIRMLGKE